MRQKTAVSGVWALAAVAVMACAGAQVAPQGNAAAVNATGTAITAAAAGVAWVAGGGCKLQGCPYGSYCNMQSGYCAVRRCSLGCPEGTVCNEGLDRCQAHAPPALPNDLLPQDSKLANPPGVH
ncbi:MAG TPA: hypothetical protein VG963_17225 [Polyangiaceae bacterium]|nr:hypothetical protein [Polyangiaceae bacterium]